MTPELPAGAGRETERAAPAGPDQRAAQLERVRRMQASYKRGKRGRRRKTTWETLGGKPGMIRRPPPEGNDAA